MAKSYRAKYDEKKIVLAFQTLYAMLGYMKHDEEHEHLYHQEAYEILLKLYNDAIEFKETVERRLSKYESG